MFGWLRDNWKTVATIAAATVVFVAVTALTGGLGAPAMAALLAGGFASGVTGSVVANLLDGKPVSVKDAVFQGATTAIITVATAGLGRVFAPVVSKVAGPVLSRILPEAAVPFATRTVANTTVGATLGAGTQVAQNALTGRPLGENVKQSAAFGGVIGAFIEPLQRLLPAPRNPDARLVHLTTAEGDAGIRATGQLNGRRGIFALPADAVDQSTAMKVLRTGIEPGKTTHPIPIPESANGLFEEPIPIGPYSLMKSLGGVRFAPPGSIDVTTGAFTPSGAAIGPRVLIYLPDVVIYAAGAVTYAVTRATEAPAPSSSTAAVQPGEARSEGMTKALGAASR